MLHIVREHCVAVVRDLWKELEFNEFQKSELLQYLNNPQIQDSLGLMKCCRRLLKSQELHHNCSENPCEEDVEKMKHEVVARMRKRKDALRERSEKKVKINTFTTGDREAPYDLEKVLKELGESPNSSKNSGKKSKDGGGGPRARCSGGKKKSKNNSVKKEIIIAKETTPSSSDTEEKDSDDVSTISMVSTHSRASSRTESIVGSPKSSTDSGVDSVELNTTHSGLHSPKKTQKIKDSVNIPNYDQIVQFNRRLWNQVEEKSKQGLVHYFGF